jgi:hypothetical protein
MLKPCLFIQRPPAFVTHYSKSVVFMSSPITPMPTIAARGPTAGLPKSISPSPGDFITLSQALNVWNAAEFADRHLGKRLNTYIVIAFSEAKDWVKGRRSDKEHRAVRERFLKAIRDWHQRNGLEFINVSSDENPPSGGTGPHINILLHLPEDRYADLRPKLFKFLQGVGGWDDINCPDKPRNRFKRRGLVIKPLLGRRPMNRADSQHTVAYILKGIHPHEPVVHEGRRMTISEMPYSDIKHYLTLADALAPQGNVRSVRRTGSSVGIRRSARKAAGWSETKDLRFMSEPYRRQVLDREFQEIILRTPALVKKAMADAALRASKLEESTATPSGALGGDGKQVPETPDLRKDSLIFAEAPCPSAEIMSANSIT